MFPGPQAHPRKDDPSGKDDFRSASSFHEITTLSFVIPSAAEGPAVPRGPFLEMFFDRAQA
jgi:hypothetical protein